MKSDINRKEKIVQNAKKYYCKKYTIVICAIRMVLPNRYSFFSQKRESKHQIFIIFYKIIL